MQIFDHDIHPDIRKEGIFLRRFFRFKSEKNLVQMQLLLTKAKRFMKTPSLCCKEFTVSFGTNPPLRICVYHTRRVKPGAVGLLWLHGGGYAIGTPEQDIGFIQNFTKAANCIVVAPDYRVSLNAPYPAAFNDCYHALLWMHKNAGRLGIRDDQLFIGGNSAGGGLAVAVALKARDTKQVRLAFQMPLYPMLDDRMETPSSQHNNAPVWDSTANAAAWRMYLGKLYETNKVPAYAAPARETNYAGLPPAYTFVGGIEPFLDETKEYIHNLKKAGVEAELDIYPGCFHGFHVACKNVAISQQATKRYLKKFQYAAEHYFQPQGKK